MLTYSFLSCSGTSTAQCFVIDFKRMSRGNFLKSKGKMGKNAGSIYREWSYR